jgi:hypothetical protein
LVEGVGRARCGGRAIAGGPQTGIRTRGVDGGGRAGPIARQDSPANARRSHLRFLPFPLSFGWQFEPCDYTSDLILFYPRARMPPLNQGHHCHPP